MKMCELSSDHVKKRVNVSHDNARSERTGLGAMKKNDCTVDMSQKVVASSSCPLNNSIKLILASNPHFWVNLDPESVSKW